LKITFLGAAHEVTGSMTLIEVGDKKGIVDCGMEQGKDIFVNQELPIAPGELDFVLLTHAHIDHSGNLPLLYKNGFRGNIYATSATCSLSNIMLRDCAHIQMQEAEWKTRKAQRNGGEPVPPLYTLEDVEGTLAKFIPCSYHDRIQVNDCVEILFHDMGHLLGSAAIEVWLTEGNETKKITFSGDVGNKNKPILNDPCTIEDTEYLVMESTYGDRDHDAEEPDYVKNLTEIIQKTMDRGGNVVIPAFAVGRTQELLYFIREIKEKKLVHGHEDFPVYIDSPLAIEATSVFMQCDTEFLDDDIKAIIHSGVNPIMFPSLKIAVSQEESKLINEDPTPKVIISSSGMCDAGRIRHHLKHNLWRSESTILFVGYQAVGTLGRVLVDGAKHVKLYNEDIQVNAEITALPGISGHADRTGLINWLTAIPEKPNLVFLNHGDPDACEALKTQLTEEYGYNVFAPYSGTSFNLLTGKPDVVTEGILIKKPTAGEHTPKQNPVFDALIVAAEGLLKIAKSLSGSPNKDLSKFTEQINKLADKLERYKNS